MLQIKDTLISQDLIDKKFCCDLEKCKGACCVKGDAGAPLLPQEVELLRKIIGKIKPYLRKAGVYAIEKQGTHVIDEENETVTPLVKGKECAYVIFDKGIARCGIEKAFDNGAITFRKPLSCHLYPLRLKKYEQFIAVNYDKWEICEPARILGEKLDLSVYNFVKDALIRRFGKDWFMHLKVAEKKLQTE